MKLIFAIIIVLAAMFSPPNLGGISHAHAQQCLNPAEQRKAISNGKAKRFGVVASQVSKRLQGTVYNGELCRRGGQLVYILTIVKKNGVAVRTVVDAKSGR